MRKEDPFHHQGSTNQKCLKHHVTKSISGVSTVLINALMHALHRRCMDPTRLVKNAWRMPFQMRTNARESSANVTGWFGNWRRRRSISSYACSIGDKSGDTAGHGNTLTFCWVRKSVTTRATCGLALSCCSVTACWRTNGTTWACRISSR